MDSLPGDILRFICRSKSLLLRDILAFSSVCHRTYNAIYNDTSNWQPYICKYLTARPIAIAECRRHLYLGERDLFNWYKFSNELETMAKYGYEKIVERALRINSYRLRSVILKGLASGGHSKLMFSFLHGPPLIHEDYTECIIAGAVQGNQWHVLKRLIDLTDEWIPASQDMDIVIRSAVTYNNESMFDWALDSGIASDRELKRMKLLLTLSDTDPIRKRMLKKITETLTERNLRWAVEWH